MTGPEVKFRLNEFKQIARWLDTHLPPPIAFFLKGWLWGLEEAYIDAKVESTIDEAIDAYSASEEALSVPEGVQYEYYEEESEVEGLPIIGIRTKTD
jgi:hypothetical protein